MIKKVVLAVIGVLAAPVIGEAHLRSTGPMSEQSKSCWGRADQRGLQGEDRRRFHATCMKGSLTPKRPIAVKPRTEGAEAVTNPSGVDPKVRSEQCNAQATKLGLRDSAYQAFRKSCLAGAGPVENTGVGAMTPRPTPAKKNLENLTNTPPH